MWRDLAQPSHLLIIAVLLVILFGWKKLPDAARSVGRSMRIFKSEVAEMKSDGKQSRPSAAASDTVAGDVVPPQPSAAQQHPQPQQQPQSQQYPQYQPGPAAPPPPPPQAPADRDAAREPERHENPAL